MRLDVKLLLLTIALAVALSVSMWVLGFIPFDPYTSALHVVSIYIGVAGVLTYQRARR